ncbi:MAG TPA: hypothetical protein VGL61_22955 [Kofleriaceae bacterium]|jgi:hypothetical protein
MRVWLAVCLVACGSSNNGPDASSADSTIGGSGMTEPCAITVTSAPVTGSSGAPGGDCMPTIDDSTATIMINFEAVTDPLAQEAMGQIACMFTEGMLPQQLGFRPGGSDSIGCAINVSSTDLAGSAASDAWAATAASQVDVTITDLVHVSGTLSIMLVDGSGANPMTIGGTF